MDVAAGSHSELSRSSSPPSRSSASSLQCADVSVLSLACLSSLRVPVVKVGHQHASRNGVINASTSPERRVTPT